ncbi:hypothetical protein PG989_012907 [Apiospora arundinis]
MVGSVKCWCNSRLSLTNLIDGRTGHLHQPPLQQCIFHTIFLPPAAKQCVCLLDSGANYSEFAPARRHLHRSTILRAAAAPPTAPPPTDDPNKPDDEANGTNKDDGPTTEENLFGENGLNENGNNNGEPQGGRQRRRIGGSATTTRGRRRAPEELPTVQLPQDFQNTHVYRRSDEHESPFAEELPEARLDAQHIVEELIKKSLTKDASRSKLQAVAAHVQYLADIMLQDSSLFATSDKSSVDDARLGQIDALARANRICLFTLAAVKKALANEGDPEYRDLPTRELSESDLYKAAALIEVLYYSPGSHKSSLKRTALRNLLTSDIPYGPYLRLGGLHHQALQEVVSSVRSELVVECPKSLRSTDIRRPVTILDFPYYRGPSWARHVINDVANEVDANVLHLTAQDLGHVVGPYLGQDISRAPGPCSLLGYNAASHSGRLQSPKQEGEEREGENPASMGFLIFDNLDRSKRDTKKSQTLLEGLLGGSSNREKSEGMWEDLKINTAIEQLITAAESDAAEQKPLIVHIHDFNALGLASSAMLNKLRKTVDTLWADGRKIALVGSCSSQNAPKPYLDALKYSAVVEHVITLHGSASEQSRFLEHEQNDYLEENTNNIKATLHSLLRPSYPGDMPEIRFKMQLIKDIELRALSCDAVLPFAEVYRICKAMIGARNKLVAAFDQPILEEALRLVQSIDEGAAGVTRATRPSDRENRSSKDAFFASSPGDPRRENHEERLLSCLVDAKGIRTTFNDIHAPKETIESVKMLTQLSLQRPEAFSYGVLATDRIPGCLLYGPPGTGKTLLAKAVAKESGANMMEVSAATINNMYVGESEKNVRALFSLAKKNEPMVIFIDEADALLGARGGNRTHGNQREVMNQFLREWDGLDTMKAFIMVATNRPFDLDDAVLRRLPRKLLVDLPLENDRAAILRIHLKGEKVDDSVSVEELAKRTPLYSGSDLKNVCVAAAMAAVKEELEASNTHTGAEPYQWAQRRVLHQRHFDKGLAEISASVSEDMSTMNAIRKFDERYGDGKSRKKKKGMGFEVIPEATDSHEVRVRGANR